MANSIIYTGNNVTQATTAAGTTITFPNVVRRYGQNLGVSGGNVVASGTGYYEGEVNLTVEGTVAGTVIINVLSNGAVIPYATASIVATSDSIDSVTIPFVVRNTCGCISNTISVVVSGVATNVTNAGIVVSKE